MGVYIFITILLTFSRPALLTLPRRSKELVLSQKIWPEVAGFHIGSGQRPQQGKKGQRGGQVCFSQVTPPWVALLPIRLPPRLLLPAAAYLSKLTPSEFPKDISPKLQPPVCSHYLSCPKITHPRMLPLACYSKDIPPSSPSPAHSSPPEYFSPGCFHLVCFSLRKSINTGCLPRLLSSSGTPSPESKTQGISPYAVSPHKAPLCLLSTLNSPPEISLHAATENNRSPECPP